MDSVQKRSGSLGIFRALWLLVAGAGALGVFLSWRTGHPEGWQPIFMLIFAVIGALAGFVALDGERLRGVRGRFLALRKNDGLLALMFVGLVVGSLAASVYLTADSLTYLGAAPLTLGLSLLALIIVGSSDSRRSLLEIIAKGMIALIAAVVIVVAADVATSLYYRQIDYWHDNSTHQRVAGLGWGLRPNLNLRDGDFTTNSVGHRTPIEPDTTSPEMLVIGVQGDSQLEGFSVANGDTFDQYLQACLGEAGIAATVVNLGAGGYDLHHYLTQSYTVVEQYNLDWLVMLFNARNDYDRAMLEAAYGAYRPFWELEDGELRQVTLQEPFALQIFPVEFQDAYAEYNQYLDYADYIQFSIDPDHPLSSSWLYITVSRWLWDVRPRREPSQAESDAFEFYLSGWWKYESPLPKPFSSYRPTFEALMTQWSQQADNVQVFVLPDRREILWEEKTEALVAPAFERMGKSDPDPTYFNDWVMEVFAEIDVPAASFYADMMSADDTEALFLPGDSHFSEAGYHLIADAACQQLQSRLETD